MLYHAPDLERGLAEIARVLEPRGTLVAVTNAVDHLRELRELVAYPLGLEGVFNRENGEAHLRRHFSRVERRDADGVVVVRDRAKLVAYRDSLSVDSRAIPNDVELPFLVHRRSSIFVATK